MQIRIFKKGDEEAVRNLISSILNGEFHMERKAYAETDLEKIQEIYSGSRNVFFVGEVNRHIVATVAVKEDDKNTALLRRLFVDPAYRGKQYGSLLLDEVLRFCRKKGYKKVVFRGAAGMKAAASLAQKKGFSEVERFHFGEVEMVHYALAL